MRARRAGVLAACLLLLAAVGQGASQERIQGAPLTAPERRQLLEATGAIGIDLSPLDDATLVSAVLELARRELGLRIRPSEVDRNWGLYPEPRNIIAEFEAARAAGTLGSWVQGLSPRSGQYAALVQASETLRAAAAGGPRDPRVEQIEANLERLRWLPRPLPADRVEVNVAAAEATLFRQDQPALRMKIVVGAPATKTPMFVSYLDAVVFNPPWNVPSSIARNEILPKAARDPGYLARNGYRMVNGQLQQRPGPGNALGRVKFDLPSPFGVYLHDTPGKAAFDREVRTLSHGCMRLQKPRELALELLKPQGWTDARIGGAINAGTTQRVSLERPTALIVGYQTAFVDEAGVLRFVPDVYGWDAKLTSALAGTAPYAVARAASDTDCAGAQSLAG